MSLSGAMANAVSGLTANARAIDVIANNVANAQSTGFAPRTLTTAANANGGVKLLGITRAADLFLLNDRRAADADAAGSAVLAGFYKTLEDRIGIPGEGGGLGDAIAGLSSALIQATAAPDQTATLAAVKTAAAGLSGKLNTLSGTVQDARGAADADIARGVDLVNAALAQTAGLNARIRSLTVAGQDASALVDQRQAVLDGIAPWLPLREIARADGTVALFTTGGAMLLDGGSPARLGFAPARAVTPDMTTASGGLSGLTLNGLPLTPATAFQGAGRLAADFALRDTLAPAAQADLDGFALDLAQRFADPAVDPGLTPGAAGLFTDAGAPVTAAAQTGLSGRLTLNAAVDPARGGALFRLRDGLAAATPGDSGNGSILNAMLSALDRPQVPTSGGLATGPTDSSGLAAQLLGTIATARLGAENAASFSANRASALGDRAAAQGVDTDQQMQQLLLIEKSYAANAKVIQTADAMLQALLQV